MHIPQQVSDRVKEAPAQVLRAVFAGIGQVLLVADRIRSRAAEEERDRAAAAAQPTQPARPAQPRREAAAPARETPAPPRVTTRWRSLDETGNVRLLPRDDEAEDEEPPAAPAEPRFVPGPAAEVPVAEADPAADTVEEIPVISEPVAAAEVPAAEPDTVEEIPVISEPVAIAEVPDAESAAAAADVAPTPAEPTPAEPTPADQAAEAGLQVLPVANYDGLTIASLRARLRSLDPAQLRVLIDYEKAHAGRADVMTMFERRITKLESEA